MIGLIKVMRQYRNVGNANIVALNIAGTESSSEGDSDDSSTGAWSYHVTCIIVVM